jgi:hypothetical protein
MSLFTGLCRNGDEAGACKKVMADEQNNLQLGEGHAYFQCMLHGGHLCVGLYLHHAGIEHLNSSYQFTMLMGSGGYFMRMIFAARVVIRSKAAPLDAPAPQRQLDLSEEFFKMCEPKFSDPSLQKRMDIARNKLLKIFNGGFLRMVSSRVLGHYCDGCCRNWEDTLEKMCEAVIGYLMASRPQNPALARWTLIAPALKFILRLWCLHGLLPQLLQVAFESLSSKLYAEADAADETLRAAVTRGYHIEAEVLTEWHWNAANGKRLKSITVYFLNQQNRETQFRLVLALDCMQYVSVSMLKHRDASCAPLLMDLLNEEYSPFVTAMQYFSTLLSLDHTRIQLFGYLCGHTNADDFCQDVDRLLRLRQLLLSIDAWIYAKLWTVVNGSLFN